MNIFVLVTALALIIWRFNKDFGSGLACSVALLVSLPKQVQLILPDALPALTIHRLIVMVLFVFWLKEGKTMVKSVKFPFKSLLLWILATQGISALFSPDFVSSIKAFLYYAIENLLFFMILIKSVRDRENAIRIVRAVCLGLLGVAILAFIEKYKGYSPMQYFPGFYLDEGSVMATFSHRILLGAAMAMSWPLCMLWIAKEKKSIPRMVAWLASFLCIGACYFAHSRGPWMALVLVGVTLGLLGSSIQRKRLHLCRCACAGCSGLKQRGPGNAPSRTSATFAEDSAQQESYQWRWELWHKAWSEISQSPIRMIFGYGPGTSESMNWEGEVSFENIIDSFASWDNTWAAYLLECGLVGFGVLLCFYVALMCRMLKIWHRTERKERDLPAFIIAALAVYIFMQTNVKIFAPQLDFIFWTTLAAGIALEGNSTKDSLTEHNQGDAEPALEVVCSSERSPGEPGVRRLPEPAGSGQGIS